MSRCHDIGASVPHSRLCVSALHYLHIPSHVAVVFLLHSHYYSHSHVCAPCTSQLEDSQRRGSLQPTDSCAFHLAKVVEGNGPQEMFENTHWRLRLYAMMKLSRKAQPYDLHFPSTPHYTYANWLFESIPLSYSCIRTKDACSAISTTRLFGAVRIKSSRLPHLELALVEAPLDVVNAPDREVCEGLEGGGGKVQVVGVAARAAIDDIDGH